MLSRVLIKEDRQIVLILLRFLEVSAILSAGFIAFFYKFDDLSLPYHYLSALILAAILVLIAARFFDIYESFCKGGWWAYLGSLCQVIFMVFMLLAGLAFITKSGESYSREWFSWWALLTVIFFIMTHGCFLLFLRIMHLYGLGERHVIVIGAGNAIDKLIHKIKPSLWTGFRIVTIFTDSSEVPSTTINHIPLLKTPSDLNHYLNHTSINVEEIWLAFPLQDEARVKHILHELRHHAITKRLVLDLYGLDFLNMSVTDLGGLPVLNICSTPMVGMNRIIKAMEDRLLASLILLLISPLFLMIAILVKLSSKGPVFYRQKRVGWNGKEFEMLKFRTMPVGVETTTGPVWAKEGENRATKMGAWLRRLSLDELPQFINVLLGDMSIVGPRPERLYFVEQFKDEIPRYMQKHMVKAGITGWAQINGWRGNTNLQKRIEYDLYYIENWSLSLDIKIIFLTIFHGFINKNAY